MEKLINELKYVTRDSKAIYLKLVKEFAEKQLARNIARKEAYFKSSLKTSTDKNFYYKEQKWAHNTPYWHFTEEFIVRMQKEANQHYENCILKLVERVKEKGLNPNTLKINSAHIDVNLNVVIFDENQKIEAKTIIAGGPIQKPHYRYLVK